MDRFRSWSRLLRTTAGRTAFRLTVVFTAVLGLCIAATFYAQMRYIDHDVARGLHHELRRLVHLHKTESHGAFTAEIADLRRRSLADEQLCMLVRAGDRFPEPLKIQRDDGELFNLWVDDHFISGLSRDEWGYWPAAVVRLDDGCRLLISIHSQINEALRHQVLPGFILLDVLLVVGMLSVGGVIGRDLLLKVDEVNATARAITAGDLSQRFVQDGSGDEFDELRSHFNGMLGKTERLISGMRRVSDNVAHDLRKPLSHILSGLEVTLLEPRSPEGYREAIEDTVVQIETVIATFNSLLQIARVESGAGPRQRVEVELGALVVELAELYEEVAQPIETSCEPGLLTLGDPHLLRQALSNLIENAIKFSPSHEAITVRAYREGATVHLGVGDRGPGIPAEQYEFVLERFSRLEEARSTPGNGLGLAMVKATMDLHGGAIALADNQPGLLVDLSFPVFSGQGNGPAKFP